MSSGMSICETVTTSTPFAAVKNNSNGSGSIYTTQNNLLLKNLLKFYEIFKFISKIHSNLFGTDSRKPRE